MSNVSVSSNVYPVGPRAAKNVGMDERFRQEIRGGSALRKCHLYLLGGANDDDTIVRDLARLGLPEWKVRRQLLGGCSFADGENPHGPVRSSDGNLNEECRCTNVECEYYSTCAPKKPRTRYHGGCK